MFMKMITNDVLTKQNFITKVLLKEGNAELSKDLKVKVMAMRIEYAKIRKHLEEDLQAFLDEATSEELKTLRAVPENQRTEEQNSRLQELAIELQSEYNAYVNKRLQNEEIVVNDSLTEDEFYQLVEVNAGNDVEINGQQLNSADFLELLHSTFVKD